MSKNEKSPSSLEQKKMPTPNNAEQQSANKMKDAQTILMNLNISNNIKKIKEFLAANPNLSIIKIKNAQKYSLLHTACLNNQLEICRVFINHEKALGSSPSDIKSWINNKTSEGFRPLHYASFKGNIPLIKLLEEHGADIEAKNNRGLNVVHIAAQGDQPVSIAYFKKKGISLLATDNNGSTALHWAAYFGMENATYYLTSWGCNVNQKDNEFGCTPLHLGVNSGNFKVVKRLLVKGANTKIKNKEGKDPLDLAVEGEYEGIIELLKGGNGLLSCLGVKSGVKREKKYRNFVFFLFLLVAVTAATVLLIFPFADSLIWIKVNAGLLGVAWLSFLSAWLRNPGQLKNKKGNIFELLQKHDPHLICPDCVILKPERSRHCDVCNSCISVYDHHCPWINNCVGAKNYGSFIIFIFSTLLGLGSLAITVAFHFQNSQNSPLKDNVFVNIYNIVFEKVDEHTRVLLRHGASILIIVVTVLFELPLLGLNYVHFVNLLSGKTTNERFTFNTARGETFKDQHHEHRTISRKYSKIIQKPSKCFQWCSNCTSMCCKNAKDKKYNYSEYQVL